MNALYCFSFSQRVWSATRCRREEAREWTSTRLTWRTKHTMASSWMAFCPVDWDSSVMDRWETTTLKWTPKVAEKVSERGMCQLNCGTLSNLFLSLFLSLFPPSNAPRHFDLISSFLGFQIFFLSPFPLFSLFPLSLSPPSLSLTLDLFHIFFISKSRG